MAFKFSSFAYKIDYDKAIAEDEMEIARLTDPRLVAVTAELLPHEHALGHGAVEVFAFVVGSPERRAIRAAIFKLTDADLCAVAMWYDILDAIDDPMFVAGSSFATTAAALDRGKALAARLDGFHFMTEPERRKALSKARASLARHKRNREKHG
jgi:hypothetical protein